MDHIALPPSCQTAECYQVSNQLQASLTPKWRAVNKCLEWDEFVCGGFHRQKKIPQHRTRITTMTDMADDVDNMVREFLDQPYAEVKLSLADSELKIDGSEEVDVQNLKLAADYYQSCMSWDHKKLGPRVFLELMQEVNGAFAKMDTVVPAAEGYNLTLYQPAMDTSGPIDFHDRFMVRDAQINLARLNIFPFVKFAVQQSFYNPDKSVVVITPHIKRAVPDKWQFRYWKGIWDHYGKQLFTFLQHAHGPHALRFQHLQQIPRQMMELEKLLLDILPEQRRGRLIKNDVKQMTLDELHKLAPTLMLNETILKFPRQDNSTIHNVEVLFPEYLHELQKTLDKTSKETVRSFMMWQAFLHTEPLWEMDWVQKWRRFSDLAWAMTPNLMRKEKCLLRAKKHFGAIVDSFYLRKEYSAKTTVVVNEIAENIKTQWKRMMQSTDWMTDRGKKLSIRKLDTMTISIGHPRVLHLFNPESLAGFYAGAEVRADKGKATEEWQDKSSVESYSLRRPVIWTHLHDFFNLERWHVDRTWARLNKAPEGPEEWPIDAHSQEVHYSPLRNQLFIPAGLLRMLIFGNSYPGWLQYGSLGTFIGHEMTKAIDGVGQQYQVNGSIAGETWPKADWKKYSKKTRCFQLRWMRGGRTNASPLHDTKEEAIAAVDGMEAAYRAWLATEVRQDLLPGLEHFTFHELYWVARTQPFCGNHRLGRYARYDTDYSEKPPFWEMVTEPLFDYPGFKAAVGCGCQRCLIPPCKMFGTYMQMNYERGSGYG